MRGVLPVLAIAWQAALFGLAVLGPLLASGHPIVLTVIDPVTAATSDVYPLLRHLTREDWIWLMMPIGVALTIALVRWRVPGARVLVSALMLAGIVGIFSFAPREPLETFGYAEREARDEARAVYTLVPFSPNERAGDRDGRFLAPGTWSDEPLARVLAAGLGVARPAKDDLIARVFLETFRSDRVNRLPIDAGRKTVLKNRPLNSDAVDYELEAERMAREVLRGSGRRHVLGTDRDGQDVLSRLIHGCRLAATVGLIAAGIATAIGVALGAIMGYFGGWIDLLLSRLVEIVMGVPLLFVLVLGAAVMPRSLEAMMALIACFTWPAAARYTRAEFLKLRSADFALAARAAGLPLRSVLLRHLLPNAAAPVIIDASFTVAAAIVLEATLGYLGLGPPGRASWGSLLASATSETGEFLWWLAAAPGAAVFLTALSYNIMGEALRDRLDPRTR